MEAERTARVNRHTGGLEKLKPDIGAWVNVNRHTGGLESISAGGAFCA